MGQHVLKVFAGVDAQPAAVLHDGVEDGAFFARFDVAEEQPVLGSELGRADGILDEVVVDLDPAVDEEEFELRPLAQGILDGFAEFAFGQDDLWSPHSMITLRL